MSFFSDHFEQREAEFMSHVDDQVKQMIEVFKETGARLDWAGYQSLRLNSYERKLLRPFLDDDALLELIKVCQGNSQYQPLPQLTLSRHYDEALIAELLPMLVDRFRALGSECVKLLAEADAEYNRTTNDLIKRHADQIAEVKKIAVEFYYWWHNTPGTNTEQGFDEFMEIRYPKTKENPQSDCPKCDNFSGGSKKSKGVWLACKDYEGPERVVQKPEQKS